MAYKRLPTALRTGALHNCAHPSCYMPRQVMLGWDGMALSFCASHAEDKAADAEVLWLSPLFAVCPRCSRTVPRRTIGGHYTVRGTPCPSDWTGADPAGHR